MLPTSLDTSFILQNFYSYFSQLMFEKQRALAGALPEIDKPQDKEKDTNDVSLAKHISKELATLLEEQALLVLKEGGEFSALYYRQAQYIMAALGDEIFLNFSWPGQEIWDTTLIEMQVFGTQIAGTKFFEDLDDFLATRDPLKVDIGALYYFALALGFRGKYRGVDDHGIIKSYKDQLFLFVLRRSPQLFSGKRKLFPEAYAYEADQGKLLRLPNPRQWYLFLGLFLGILSVFGSVSWYILSWDFSALLSSIISGGGGPY